MDFMAISMVSAWLGGPKGSILAWFPPGEVFNFVFELRPKQGQALPVVKRVFPATEAVAKRAAPWPLRPSVPSSEVQIMERHEAH